MLVTFSLPEFNLKKQISWAFHVGDRYESSSTYVMIIGQLRYLLGELGIIIIFNNQTVTCDTDTHYTKLKENKCCNQLLKPSRDTRISC
jgi:hypothetical protein